VLQHDARSPDATGRFLIDEQVLAAHGLVDLARYSVVPGSTELLTDLFLEHD
jgi:citronellol/citronellal dehydrogenase